jgi:hypothetical protein
VEWSGGPIVLVIDALDECGIEKDRKNCCRLYRKGFSDLPPFIRVIVPVAKSLTSRIHSDRIRLCTHIILTLILRPIGMISLNFYNIVWLRYAPTTNTFLPSDWPGDDKIRALTERAAGLFVWASTACLYIDSYDPPDRRLEELITQQSVDTSSAPFASLDRLYKTGLQSAGSWDDPHSALIVATS